MSMPSIQIPTPAAIPAAVPSATSSRPCPSALPVSTGTVPATQPEQPHTASLGLVENVREVIMENQVVINTFIAGECSALGRRRISLEELAYAVGHLAAV